MNEQETETITLEGQIDITNVHLDSANENYLSLDSKDVQNEQALEVEFVNNNSGAIIETGEEPAEEKFDPLDFFINSIGGIKDDWKESSNSADNIAELAEDGRYYFATDTERKFPVEKKNGDLEILEMEGKTYAIIYRELGLDKIMAYTFFKEEQAVNEPRPEDISLLIDADELTRNDGEPIPIFGNNLEEEKQIVLPLDDSRLLAMAAAETGTESFEQTSKVRVVEEDGLIIIPLTAHGVLEARDEKLGQHRRQKTADLHPAGLADEQKNMEPIAIKLEPPRQMSENRQAPVLPQQEIFINQGLKAGEQKTIQEPRPAVVSVTYKTQSAPVGQEPSQETIFLPQENDAKMGKPIYISASLERQTSIQPPAKKPIELTKGPSIKVTRMEPLQVAGSPNRSLETLKTRQNKSSTTHEPLSLLPTKTFDRHLSELTIKEQPIPEKQNQDKTVTVTKAAPPAKPKLLTTRSAKLALDILVGAMGRKGSDQNPEAPSSVIGHVQTPAANFSYAKKYVAPVLAKFLGHEAEETSDTGDRTPPEFTPLPEYQHSAGIVRVFSQRKTSKPSQTPAKTVQLGFSEFTNHQSPADNGPMPSLPTVNDAPKQVSIKNQFLDKIQPLYVPTEPRQPNPNKPLEPRPMINLRPPKNEHLNLPKAPQRTVTKIGASTNRLEDDNHLKRQETHNNFEGNKIQVITPALTVAAETRKPRFRQNFDGRGFRPAADNQSDDQTQTLNTDRDALKLAA